MSSRERKGGPAPALGSREFGRWIWRQLTSMRTALLLLLLLAIAAVPGSVVPQRGVDARAVEAYMTRNPTLSPWLDRFGFFDVYTSPWFSAIYLLLMVSLIGCIVPRTRQHWRAMRAQPPRTPRRLARLPEHRTVDLGEVDPELAEQTIRTVLKSRRFRLRRPDQERPGEVAAENGYLRETGNLVFHTSLLAVIISVAVGHLYGWRGEVILPEGGTFTSTQGRYDTLDPGTWVDPGELQPFVLTLENFDVDFDARPGSNFAAPLKFSALVTVADRPGARARSEVLEVNSPVQVGGTSIYLLGNGYAPVITVRDAQGEVLYSQVTPFLTQDNFYASSGAVKVSSTDPQLGFHGEFLPTFSTSDQGPISSFPDLFNPVLILSAYQGELFPGGRPQSVYTLDVSQMEEITNAAGAPLVISLVPGEEVELPDGLGTVTFDGVSRWVGLVMRSDPGRLPVLISSLVMLVGLIAMLTVPRRRIFARILPQESTTEAGASVSSAERHTVVEIGALAKGADPGLARVLDDLVAELAGDPDPASTSPPASSSSAAASTASASTAATSTAAGSTAAAPSAAAPQARTKDDE